LAQVILCHVAAIPSAWGTTLGTGLELALAAGRKAMLACDAAKRAAGMGEVGDLAADSGQTQDFGTHGGQR